MAAGRAVTGRSFDPKCRELAEHFLADEPALLARADDLAGWIQWWVETWIETERPNNARDGQSEYQSEP